MRYDDLADCTGSMALGKVVLRDKNGKDRRLSARTREEQATIISAIDDVLARHRCDSDADEPLPYGHVSDGAQPRLH